MSLILAEIIVERAERRTRHERVLPGDISRLKVDRKDETRIEFVAYSRTSPARHRVFALARIQRVLCNDSHRMAADCAILLQECQGPSRVSVEFMACPQPPRAILINWKTTEAKEPSPRYVIIDTYKSIPTSCLSPYFRV